jgi:hypothetical protein
MLKGISADRKILWYKKSDGWRKGDDPDFKYQYSSAKKPEGTGWKRYPPSKRKQFMIDCTFTSVWDCGSIITTLCSYDPETGEVSPETSDGPDPTGALTREYITLASGDELPVCTHCHAFVLKQAVGDLPDLSYGQYGTYSDPDCESNE